jgi:hypothetical protein
MRRYPHFSSRERSFEIMEKGKANRYYRSAAVIWIARRAEPTWTSEAEASGYMLEVPAPTKARRVGSPDPAPHP